MNSNVNLRQMPRRSLDIAKGLRRLLIDRRMTASELARTAGISRKTLQNWLSGACPADIRQLTDVAEILAVTLEELCFGLPPPIEIHTTQMPLAAGLGAETEIAKYEITVRRI